MEKLDARFRDKKGEEKDNQLGQDCLNMNDRLRRVAETNFLVARRWGRGRTSTLKGCLQTLNGHELKRK